MSCVVIHVHNPLGSNRIVSIKTVWITLQVLEQPGLQSEKTCKNNVDRYYVLLHLKM